MASFAIPILAVAGCSSQSSYFPAEVGSVWTYDVRTGFGAQHVQEAKVVRRLTVAGTEGFEVSGALGSTRLAWKRGVLWFESFANVRARPPLPVLQLDGAPMNWTGVLETAFGEEKALARLESKTEELAMGGRKFETLRTELRLERPSGETTISTWFAKGVGIVRQEQRTRGALDLRVEWVSGPAARN